MEAVVGQAGSGRGLRGWYNPLTVGAAIVAVVLFAVGGTVLYQHQSARSRQTKEVDTAIAASQAAYAKGDYQNALGLVGGMAAKATSSGQKARVYQMEAQAANGANKLSDAAQYYTLKHQADPSTADADAYTLGAIYQRLGQKDKALAQYKTALQYASTHRNQYGSDAPAIQATIDQLEGKAQ
ncbi:MAG TPA: hypothetical protein VLF71_05635 [Candidatus Saccharimonadales bacterium]|nr:hypothetical protein [Candidatus Saccharimonadales bacterium]